MLQSQLFTKTKQTAPKDETSVNAQLLIRAGYIDKLMAGVYSMLPLGLRVMKKIENIIREEINKLGGQEVFMPSLQPKDNWLKTNRWNTMDDLYKVKDASSKEFALGPTHEEVVVPLVQKFINSYKDIPLSVYQFQNKFRMELRSKSGILRGREFMMKDLYSFHLNEQDLDNYYEKAKLSYFKIFKRAGLKDNTYLTFASGGTFSKYSHEFQTVTLAGEDTIYVCQGCKKLAINKEIKDEVKECPNCKSTDFKEEKAIEVGNIFKLMNKYTKPFGLKVKDEKGEDKEIIMGCYGIGLGRVLGTIVEVHHDDKGIIWPKQVAPFQIHLLCLQQDNQEISNKAKEIYDSLLKNNYEVLYDDRSDSAGFKLKDADLLGMPIRIVVSQKTLEKDSVEIKQRSEEKTKLIASEKVLEEVQKIFNT